MPSNKALQTIAVANGIGDDSAFGAVTPPLYLSTNFPLTIEAQLV